MMLKYVSLELMNINSCLNHHLSLGKTMVIKDLKILEAHSVRGIVLAPMLQSTVALLLISPHSETD